VQSVTMGSPADTAGSHAGTSQQIVNGAPVTVGGDIIVAVNGQPIQNADDFGAIIAGKKPGDTVTLGVVRGSRQVDVRVTLGQRPSSVANPAAPQG
jgi:S1-C subfamily serine protease